MLRRQGAIALSFLVLGSALGTAVAAEPAGPRLAVLVDAPGRARLEIATLGPDGGGYTRLTGPPREGRGFGQLGVPTWSPDGSLLAFARGTGARGSISSMSAAGGAPSAIPGTQGGYFAAFSPDGRFLAFSRSRVERKPGRPRYDLFESTSVWIVDVATGERRQLTRWREDLYQYPSSFSPDGSTLLLTRVDEKRSGEPETVALRFDGRPSSLLVGEGAFPVYSPDGSKIALSRIHTYRVGKPIKSGWYRVRETTDLYVVDADGTNLRRLTNTPRQDELLASWDPSGERLAYSVVGDRPFRPGSKSSIMQVNADGTCPTTILTRPRVAFYGPAWQPGPGREAGRIRC